MESNPYQAPLDDSPPETPGIEPMQCPECGVQMETGYVTPSGQLYWCNWTAQSWILFGSAKISGTRPAFVGRNRLSGFRCRQCELVVFRHGVHKRAYAPDGKR